MLNIFSCASWLSVCLLWRNAYLDLLPVFSFGCIFDIELYELFAYFEINPLQITSFAHIFSHSVGCLFILFMAYFVLKLLSLIKKCQFIFVFILITLKGVVITSYQFDSIQHYFPFILIQHPQAPFPYTYPSVCCYKLENQAMYLFPQYIPNLVWLQDQRQQEVTGLGPEKFSNSL